MRIDLSQSCGHCWAFQICWHTECSTLIASSFRIWNSLAEIPSPSLDLLTAVLPKAYLTSHSRMSGSGWVTTPWWLSESLSFFVQFFHVFFPSLLDLFCFYYIFTVSIVYWAHLWMKFSFDIFNFLEEISSLSSSDVFLCFFALFIDEDLFVFPCYSLLFFLQLFVKPPQMTTLPSCFSLSLGWIYLLPPIQYCGPLAIVLQTICLLDLIPWFYLSPPLYNHRGFDLHCTWLAYWFSPLSLV